MKNSMKGLHKVKNWLNFKAFNTHVLVKNFKIESYLKILLLSTIISKENKKQDLKKTSALQNSLQC